MGSNDDWFSDPPVNDGPGESIAAPPLSVVADQSGAADSVGVDDWFTATASPDVSGVAEDHRDHDVVADHDDLVDDDLARWVSSELEAQSPELHIADAGADRDRGDDTTSPANQEDGSSARPPVRPRFVWLRRHRSAVAVAGSAGVLVVVVVSGVVGVVGSASPDEGASISALVTDSTSAVPAPVPAAVEAPWCAGRTGGQPAALDAADSGLAAIAGFERAYYVDRDGFRARSFVAENARVGSGEQIGQGIAQIPVGTEHCVLAARVGDGVYAVDLFERRPDTTSTHYRQTITTAPAPQGALITAITSREGQ